MNDAAFETQKERIRLLFAKWTKILDISHRYLMVYDWLRTPIKDHERAVMVVHASWKYLDAHVEINCERAEFLDDARLERVVVHECMHILLNEMREDDIDHEERVCSEMADIIMGLVKH